MLHHQTLFRPSKEAKLVYNKKMETIKSDELYETINKILESIEAIDKEKKSPMITIGHKRKVIEQPLIREHEAKIYSLMEQILLKNEFDLKIYIKELRSFHQISEKNHKQLQHFLTDTKKLIKKNKKIAGPSKAELAKFYKEYKGSMAKCFCADVPSIAIDGQPLFSTPKYPQDAMSQKFKNILNNMSQLLSRSICDRDETKDFEENEMAIFVVIQEIIQQSFGNFTNHDLITLYYFINQFILNAPLVLFSDDIPLLIASGLIYTNKLLACVSRLQIAAKDIARLCRVDLDDLLTAEIEFMEVINGIDTTKTENIYFSDESFRKLKIMLESEPVEDYKGVSSDKNKSMVPVRLVVGKK